MENQTSKTTARQKKEIVPKRQLRVGFFVFGALVSIKIAEYTVSKALPIGDWPYLLVLALVSAGLIIYYYKHIRQLWRSRGNGNE